MAVAGLSVLPLVITVFRWLPDRGYILARPVAVLLLAWLSWMLTNLTPLHFTRSTIALSLGLLALASWGSLLMPSQRRRLGAFWRDSKRLILIGEVLFLVFFFLFWLIRWGNPDLWHAWRGGEKPMDFAYLNAVIKSTEFPPYDPWFAGGYLNYYYFGQVMVGTLIKLVGIVPNIAYNLVLPSWFAMTALGAYCIVYNLVAAKSSSGQGEGGRSPESAGLARPVVSGLVGALFVAVFGNLAEIHLVLLKVGEGVLEGFQSTIPGLVALVRTVIGSAEVLFGGRALPIGIGEWYWNASRAIPAGPSESVITEFPFFTFLYADLHAHLIAMPLTLVSLAAALAVVLRAGRTWSESDNWRFLLKRLGLLLLWSLAIGAMRTTNTWDVPPHLLLVLGAVVIAELSRREFDPSRSVWRMGWHVIWQGGLVTLLSWSVLYWPFWQHYGSFYDSVQVWTGTRTPLWAYLVVHGLFLFAILSYLFAQLLGRWNGQRSDPVLRRLQLTVRYRAQWTRLRSVARMVGVRWLPLGVLSWLAIASLVLLELFLIVPGLIAFTRADPQVLESGSHAYRGLVTWAFGIPIAVAGLLLIFRKRLEPAKRLWTFLVLLGLAMSLGVEVLVLEGDIGRMNTVFKFYLQVWFMWGVAAATALAWIVPRLKRWHRGRGAWLGTLVVLVLCAALYPPLAASAKIRDRFDNHPGPGLDGWAYMETATYWDPAGDQYELKWDLEGIRWMLDNVVGTPVILEGHTPEYRWGARYSINTGLPTVLGWNWHQRQQRAAVDTTEVWTRANEVAYVYNEEEPALILPILARYHVRYLIVGPLERAYYDSVGLAKFEQMASAGILRTVFRNEGVTIYEVVAE
jgi:YYY domain-containing protein